MRPRTSGQAVAEVLVTPMGSHHIPPGSETLSSENCLNQISSTGNHPVCSMFPLCNIIMQKGIMYAMFTKQRGESFYQNDALLS